MIDVDKYIVQYGEKWRRLITCATEWLEKDEPSWGLDEPMDVDEFVANLVSAAERK